MSFTEFLNLLPGSPALSLLVWFISATALLYFARLPAHRSLRSLFRAARKGLRRASKFLLLLEKGVLDRNGELLFASGREAAERSIEREFGRICEALRGDLGPFPLLQGRIMAQISKMDEDYRESADVPPPPPAWIGAADALSKISAGQGETVAELFRTLHGTAIRQFRDATEEYRKGVGMRREFLRKMMPYWRNLTRALDELSGKLDRILGRAAVLERRIQEYEEMRKHTAGFERRMTASSFCRFGISALVLLVFFSAILVNFHLIAFPLSAMTGGGSDIGGFKTSEVAAMVLVLLEAATGIVLMESLRVTHLFPSIGLLEDRLRRRFIWGALLTLAALAGLESLLAFMGDRMAADLQSLQQSLGTAEASGESSHWVPTAGKMIMGFLFPFSLIMLAVPIEGFLQHFRILSGATLAGFMRGAAFSFRFLGGLSEPLGELLVTVYDLLIVPPLWLERILHERGTRARMNTREKTPVKGGA